MSRPKRRWSDNDRHFGPFTLALGDYRQFSIMLDSGHDEYPGCCLRLRAFGATLIIELPAIIKPWREKIIAGWDAATVERLRRNWYWNEYAREYGFALIEGEVHLRYGRQTNDSSTDQGEVWFLPWMQWRHVRHTLYGLDGFFVWAELEGMPWEQRHERTYLCPSLSFEFDDYDGERITARTKIEEREWLFGTGWFRWLSLFRRAKAIRSLDIRFSSEVGKRKGSWKGGTIGHSIEMRSGELHESAFQRYCCEHDMAFVGAPDHDEQEPE